MSFFKRPLWPFNQATLIAFDVQATPSLPATGALLYYHGGALRLATPAADIALGAVLTSAAWGGITGTLSDQTDLQSALDGKVATSVQVNGHALSGNITVDFADLGSLPTTLAGFGITDAVPATRTVNGHALNADVTLTAADLSLATVATSGLYNDLSGKPLLGTAALVDTTYFDAAGAATTAENAAKAYADTLVVGLLDDRGNFDASGNAFPTTGGSGSAGAILKGDTWYISVAGTLGGTAAKVGDWLRALVNTPGSTAGNWAIVEANLGYVAENSANKVTSLSGASTNTQYPSAALVYTELAGKQAAANELSLFGVHGANVASASTINLETATGHIIDVTGTTTITAITLNEGHLRCVRFTGALTLTHGSSLVLPTGANITTAAGDYGWFVGYAAGVVRCVAYQRADGTPLAGGGGSGTVLTGGLIYVDAVNGNNTTCTLGDLTKPCLTIAHAMMEASAGDTVVVYPGTYNEQVQLMVGVNMVFMEGAIVNYTGDGSTFLEPYYAAATAAHFDLTCVASGLPGSGAGAYLIVPGGADYYWINNNSTNSDPMLSGTGHEVIVSSPSDNDLASALAAAVNGGSYIASSTGAVFTFTFSVGGAQSAPVQNSLGSISNEDDGTNAAGMAGQVKISGHGRFFKAGTTANQSVFHVTTDMNHLDVYANDIKCTIGTDAGHSFADATARAADVPTAIGQYGHQADTDTPYIATGTSAGNWVELDAAVVKIDGGQGGVSPYIKINAHSVDGIRCPAIKQTTGGRADFNSIERITSVGLGVPTITVGSAATALSNEAWLNVRAQRIQADTNERAVLLHDNLNSASANYIDALEVIGVVEDKCSLGSSSGLFFRTQLHNATAYNNGSTTTRRSLLDLHPGGDTAYFIDIGLSEVLGGSTSNLRIEGTIFGSHGMIRFNEVLSDGKNFELVSTGTVATTQYAIELIHRYDYGGSSSFVDYTAGQFKINGIAVTGDLAALSDLKPSALATAGNISAAAWTTNGLKLKFPAVTLTDTSSSGTVATGYVNLLDGDTIAASSATTFTNFFNAYFKAPAAGTNVTLTNAWALGADSLKVGTSNPVTISAAGILAATNATLTTPNLGTPSALTLTNAVGLPLTGVSITGGTRDLAPDATADYIATFDNSAAANKKVLLRDALILRGYLNGFTLANNSTTAIDIAAGAAADSTGVSMLFGAAMTKTLAATWAAGNNSNGLFSGSPAGATWYHVFAILKVSDNSVDYGFDTSVTAANIPSGYTKYRRLGSIYCSSTGPVVIRAFHQTNHYFEWDAPALDQDDSTLTTASKDYALASVPLGVAVRVRISGIVSHASAGTAIYVRSPTATDSAPSATAAPGNTARVQVAAGALAWTGEFTTDTSQTIKARSSASSTTIRLLPIGYTDNL